MDELFTVKELSAKWKVTKDQIYRWIKAGLLEARRSPTGQIRVTEKAADVFWAKQSISESA